MHIKTSNYRLLQVLSSFSAAIKILSFFKKIEQNLQHCVLTTKQFINMSEGWKNIDWSYFLRKGDFIFTPDRPILGILFKSLRILLASNSIHSCSKMHSYHPKYYSWLPTCACHTSVFSVSFPTRGFHSSFSVHWFLKNFINHKLTIPTPSHFQVIIHTWKLQLHSTFQLAWHFF